MHDAQRAMLPAKQTEQSKVHTVTVLRRASAELNQWGEGCNDSNTTVDAVKRKEVKRI